MMKVRKGRLFLIFTFCILTVFATYKLHRRHIRHLLREEIAPHKTSLTSPFSHAYAYFSLQDSLRPLFTRLASFFPEAAGKAGYRISNEYDVSRVNEPFSLEAFKADDWRIATIDKELAPFEGQVFTKRDFEAFLAPLALEEDWERKFLLGYFYIKGGELYVKDFTRQHPWFKEVCLALVRLTKHAPSLPDMAFVVSMHDSLEHDSLPFDPKVMKGAKVPIFVFSKTKQSSFICLPDHEMLAGYKALETLVTDPKRQSPWQEKESKAFWRGATTSGDYSKPDWERFARSKLINASILSGDSVIDAKFSFLTDQAKLNKYFCDYCQDKGALSSFVKVEDHLQYKYLIDIDGNASTYSRFYWILRSDTMPLKVDSKFTQWYYPGLTPGVHYLGVEGDLSNLHHQVLWAQLHDDSAYQIAQQGALFAKQYLSDDGVYTYLYHLLLSYSDLYRD